MPRAVPPAAGVPYRRSIEGLGSGITQMSVTLTGDFSTDTTTSVLNEVVVFADTTGKLGKRATGTGIAVLAGGILGTITDNSSFWNTAYSERLQWSGIATGLNATTGRTSLGLGTAATQNVSAFEANLGNPAANGYILSSTVTGVRSWIVPPEGGGGGGAPTTCTYITQQPEAGLSAEQALSLLSTGLMKCTTGTGIVSTVADASTNWNTAFTERRQWDGGATNLVAATGRTSLGVVIGTNVQAWDADLDALAALTGTDVIYYRSGVAAWTPVTIGANLTFVDGTLAGSAGGGGGGGDVTGPPSSVNEQIVLFNGTSGKVIKAATLTGLVTATSGVFGTTPNNSATWDTAYTERRQWDGGSTNLNVATGRTSLGLVIGTNVQAYDTDLDAVAAIAATNAIPYRIGTGSWGTVAIGANLTFGSGSLAAGNANWDTAYTDRFKWDGAATGLNAATGRASLALDQVTNNAQTQAAIMPNTVPSPTQVPVGNAGGTAYAPRTISGSGATVSLSATGVLSISGIANASLNNSSITIGPSTVALGGTALANVTNDAQTKAAVVPNTAPGVGQVLVGNGTVYAPRNISGSGATITMSSTGVVTIDAIANSALANSSITITGDVVSLGGSISLDTITGLSSNGLVKRSGVNTLAIAVAGTDYKVGTTNAVNVRLITTVGASTFTPTAGATSLYVEGVGGGGGGGGESVTGTNALGWGGGGGGGGTAAVYISTPAGSYSVNVGAGGTAGTAAGGNGGDGGNTTFGAVLTAGGGGGGLGMTSAGVFAEAASNAYSGAGGVSTVGSFLSTGGEAVAPFALGASGTTVWGMSGAGGSSLFGMGAAARAGHSAAGGALAGVAGTKYGGGGSGAIGGTTAGTRAGGAGAQGVIRVWEFF